MFHLRIKRVGFISLAGIDCTAVGNAIVKDEKGNFEEFENIVSLNEI